MSNETTIRKTGNDVPEKLHQRPAVTPAVDVFENKDELLIVADLPGVGKDDLTLHLDKGKLTIEGHHKASGDAGDTEGVAFDYRRMFAVPQGIDAEKIAADLTAGVLRVHLPKSEALKPRQIDVKAG
jgi:HSP20 family molecular chaperone IbpA